jgi:hypothetical protein
VIGRNRFNRVQIDRRTRATGLRPAVLLAFSLLLPGVSLAGQTTEQADLKQAIAAYDAGELQQALALLQRAPAFLDARDAAIRSLYLGLVHFALGDGARARDAFGRAVRTEPGLRLDPAIHSPTRIAAFDEVRAGVVLEWRLQARDADTRGVEADSRRLWELVRSAEPEDAEATARIAALDDAVRQREAAALAAQAAADSAAAARQAETTPVRGEVQRYAPGRALALGLVVPGLGQLYTGRSVRGVLAMAAAAGSVAIGYLTERTDVRCVTEPVNNVCPPADVIAETTERPWLAAGIAGAVGVTVLSAIDALLAARAANRQAGLDSNAGETGPRLLRPAMHVTATGVRADLVRLRFR